MCKLVLLIGIGHNEIMYIYSAKKIKEYEQELLKDLGITDEQLTDKAANSFVKKFVEIFPRSRPITVFAGTGHNGLEGIIIAYYLNQKGYLVRIFIVKGEGINKDAASLLDKYLAKIETIPVVEVSEQSSLPNLKSDHIIIDSLLGLGANREPEGILKKAIHHINDQDATVVSVDLPSGTLPDKLTTWDSVIADYTFSYFRQKKSFLFKETAIKVGKLEVIDLDVPMMENYLKPSEDILVNTNLAKQIVGERPRSMHTHKGDYGHVGVIAGSDGKYGAAILTARSAMKSGPGLVTLVTSANGATAMHSNTPEVMIISDNKAEHLSNIDKIDKFNSLAIGPGIGDHKDTEEMLLDLFEKMDLKQKVVLDADALNILAKQDRWEGMLPPFSIITPHPKEFARLLGKTPKNSFERLDAAKQLAAESKMYVVLKDSYSSIVCPDGRVFYATLGNSGLAKAGSGDILSGLIAGLLAQGYGQEEAAVLGVYIHARAGELAKNEYTEYAMTASIVIDFYSQVFKELV